MTTRPLGRQKGGLKSPQLISLEVWIAAYNEQLYQVRWG